jgi:hypothetical protein
MTEVVMMNTNTVLERELVKLSLKERSKLLAEKVKARYPELFTNDTAPDRSVSRREPRPPQEDICANKHKGNLASVLAFEKAKHTRSETINMLVELFEAHGGSLTSKEVGQILGQPDKNKFAPRLSDMLHKYHLLEKTDQMRDGAYVLRLVVR